jgi:hypothetical protein
MNWDKIQKAYDSSFKQDCSVQNWAATGHDVTIRRNQEWDKGKFFLTPDMDVRDIYLDYSIISRGWCQAYGTPKIRDFIRPTNIGRVISVGRKEPWRIYAGKTECQWMYSEVLEILDIAMRYTCSLHPRSCNKPFILGDAGCMLTGYCPGHGGAHDNCYTVDLNYCTLKGFNMSHYRASNMPDKYKGHGVNIWRDPYPYRDLKVDVFDTTKNYALYSLLKKIFPKSSLLTSTGLCNHFKTVYGNSVVQGDDIKKYNHHRHVHLHLNGEIDWDADIQIGEKL